MAIHELTEEQVQTWTLEEKDNWWLKNVYRGDMPQLTIRSALTGMMLGGLLSLTNLYVGAKTGWTLGVGITSVILAYAMFKVMSKVGLASEFTILENNAMQSIATAAGYMTSPMISSLAAYMMVTGEIIPMWHTMAWITVLAILGVLFAFPFKRRFINDEQQPFPEGRAAGIVMDSLHHGEAASSMLKAKLLVYFTVLAALVRLFQSGKILNWVALKANLISDKQMVHSLPEFIDEWFYKFVQEPKILGSKLSDLTIRMDLDLPMVGAGGLMGVRTSGSLLLGALINFVLLAPWMIDRGDIVPDPKSGEINFKQITFWSLWAGVAMMTVASVLSFFAKPQILIGAFSKLFNRSQESSDVLAHIELPLRVSLIGIPLLSILVMLMARAFFAVDYWVSLVAIVMVFFFCLIAINSTGLTSITPIGAMGKLTQLSFAVMVPKNKGTNLMTAGITGEVASHSANLLSDIKPGYMLGAKPRQQAVGHVLGVIAGALLSVPVFYLVFLQVPPSELLSSTPNKTRGIETKEYPMPAAITWRGVADLLSEGLDTLKPSARYAVVAGIIIGILLECLRLATKGRFPLSPVGLGLGFLIPFHTCLSMFLGSFIFWCVEKKSTPGSRSHTVVVDNQEPICAGLIAGGALMGIFVTVIEVLVLPNLK